MSTLWEIAGGKKCMEEGCTNDGLECMLPDGDEPYTYCMDHAGPNGFCKMCGSFWGGIESFEFIHPNICDDCQTEIEREDRAEGWQDDDGTDDFFDDYP